MRTRRSMHNRGAILVVTLVCLIVLGLLAGVLVRIALAGRAQMATDERRVQAQWLASAALERAAGRLAAAPDYSGETWDLAARELGGRWPARVTIAVEAAQGRAGRRLVRVQADYPQDAPLRARQSQQAFVDARSQ